MSPRPPTLRAGPSPRLASTLLAAALLGCSPAPPPEAPVRGLAIPVRDPTPRAPDDDDPREAPPDPDPERPQPLPALLREALPSGVELLTVAQKGSPTVELRLVARGAGGSDEGAQPGLASLTLRLSVEGGAGRVSGKEAAERLAAAAAASPPALAARPEAARLSLAVHRDQAADALSLLLSALREPRLDAADFARVKRIERSQRAAERAPQKLASALALRELLAGPPQEPSAADIDRLSLADAKAFAKQRYAPGSLAVVAVGDVDTAALKAAIAKATAGWKPPPAPPPSATPSFRPRAERPRLLVVDVPARPGVELLAYAPGPDRAPENWAAASLLAELLGGAPTARLAAALAGTPPLAQDSRVALVSLGPVSLIEARASADPQRAAQAAGALLDTLRKAADTPAPDADLLGARRRALASFARSLSLPSALADELALLAALRSADGAFQRSSEALRSVDAAAVQKAARELLASGLVLVAVGDAARVAAPMSRWGEVTVVSAEKLEKVRVLPETPVPAGEKK